MSHTRYFTARRDSQPDDKTGGFASPLDGEPVPQPARDTVPAARSISNAEPKPKPTAVTADLAKTPRAPRSSSSGDAELASQAVASSSPSSSVASLPSSDPAALSRPPKNVLATFHRPLQRPAPYGVPVCDLQLRSYSVRNLEYFADFAMRAAYYLNLPASGPVPLPKRIERWTVLRGPFVHKKTPENFERITRRRLIQIQDGDKDVVQLWLAYLRKCQFYGVGMKANVWEWESLGEFALWTLVLTVFPPRFRPS